MRARSSCAAKATASSCEARPIRRRDRAKAAYFERDWGQFLSGAIYEAES